MTLFRKCDIMKQTIERLFNCLRDISGKASLLNKHTAARVANWGKAAIPYNTPYRTSKYGMHDFHDFFRMEALKSHSQRPFLFLAEGVFMYFTGAQVKSLVLRLKEHFPAAELVFDAYSPFMRWVHNLRVIRKRVGARLNWDLKHSRDLEEWSSASPTGAGIRLLDERFPFQFPEVDQRRALRVRLFSPLMSRGIGVFRYQL